MGASGPSDDQTILGAPRAATDDLACGFDLDAIASDSADAGQNRTDRGEPTLMSIAPGEAAVDPSDPAGFILPGDPESEEELSSAPGDLVGTAIDRTLFFRLPPESQDSRHRPVPAIDGYEIMGELGRGGMGVVYRARQVRLNRPCALKTILAGAHANDETTARFMAEAEAVARLQHPNVVQIYHVGEAGGLPFFELEYLDGGSLDRRLNGTPWPARLATELIRSVVRGVAEAHRRGIVHRDLKPANVLLAADGTPKVSDFGLAKSLDQDSGLTRTDTVMGSPGYMSPEQAEGKTKNVGPLADVYALGAILYELLTGRPLFRGATALETLEQVKTTEPVPPSRLVPGLSRDVETIGETLDAATGTLVGKPLTHRHRVVAAAFSPDGATVITGSWDKTARLWAAANSEPKCRPLTHQGQVDAAAFSPDGKTIVTACDDGTARTWSAATGLPVGEPMTHRAAVRTVLFSPDGKTVLTGSVDGTARFWNAATGQPVGLVLPHHGAVWAATFSPDGKTVLTGSVDGAARLWEAATSEPIKSNLPLPDGVWSVAFSSDGKTAFTGSVDGTARLWDIAGGKTLGAPLLQEGRVHRVAFSPDGKTVLTGGLDGKARLWNAVTGKRIGTAMSHRERVNGAAFSPDGKTVVTVSDDKTAQLWDAATGLPLGVPMSHHDTVQAVAFSPDGKTIVTGCWDKTAQIWDIATGKPLGLPMTHQSSVVAVFFSPDGKTVLTGVDGKAQLWDVATARPVGVSMRHQALVQAVAYSPDGKTILTGCWDQTARLWDAVTGQALGFPMRHPSAIRAVGFSRDGKVILTGSTAAVRVWTTTELPDDLDRVATWVESRTGVSLDASGSTRPLDRDDWLKRRGDAERLGGRPVEGP